jgi:CubicO group peptidase (beta-lactamase class C family)
LATARAAAVILVGLGEASARAEPSPGFASWLEAEMGHSGVPGASIAVIKNYQIEWAAGFGMADQARGVPVTSETLFQAASVSKPVTALAVMIALDERHISIDEKVDAILDRYPPLPPAQTWRLSDPFPTGVTVRMLMSHIGGTNDFHYSGYRYDYGAKPPRPIDPVPSLAEELTGQPPANTPPIAVVRPPGVTWVYSPAGYTVLQAMLTGLESKPFVAVMDDLVLAPLGLPTGGFEQPTPPALTPWIAVPYVGMDRPLNDGPRVFVAAAAGGLTTTPTDLARLIIAVQQALAGKSLGRLTPKIAQAMIERQPGRSPEGKCFPAAEAGEQACRSSWGLGFDVNLTKTFEHEADGRPTGGWFGHSGFNSGYLTIALGSKTDGRGAVIMVNIAPEDMSADVPQWGFTMRVVRRIAEDEGW